MHALQEKLIKISASHDFGKLSLRQIGKLVGCSDQPQKVKHHLLQLEKKGLLRLNRTAGKTEVVKPGFVGKTSLVAVPILGSADCGPATIYAEQNVEGYIQISGRLLSKKKDIFAIMASGHSMNKANVNGESIEDGDYVVVDPTPRTLKNGDYVLAVIDNVANIKRYFNDRSNQRIILLSESSASYSPIFIHYTEASNFLVNGKIIQVIKRPRTAWSRLKSVMNRSD